MGCSSSLAVDSCGENDLHSYIDELFDAYGKPTEQVGYTDGHYCLSKEDREEAARCQSSLLYGEILAAGVTKLLDPDHLHAGRAQVLVDMGMGAGKLVMLAFLQYPNLKLIRGIELSFSRFMLAEEALLRLVSLQPERYDVGDRIPGELLRVHTVGRRRRRTLELQRGDMWKVRDINTCDIVIMHTELTATAVPMFQKLVHQMKSGARFVTYQDLSKHWTDESRPFVQLEANVDESDQFATSWSAIKGHHLYCWRRDTASFDPAVDDYEESKEGVYA